ncbi:MAG: hypothetical protein WC455_25530 [Dehalococcoidia bacterium]|jgi:hypothetical protein
MSVNNSPHYQVLRALAAAFPHSKVTPETIATYAIFLADVELEALRRAATWCMSNEEFFPTMHKLRLAMQETDLEHRAPTAGDAFAEVKRAVVSIGYIGTPVWSHSLVGRTIEAMGGWRNFCMSEDPDGVLRGQFLKLYAALSERQANDERAALTASPTTWKQIAALAGKLALPGAREEKDR